MPFAIEQLEQRYLLTAMRVVSWNAANNPDNAVEDADFETVFEAIGNETIQGNAARISLLSLQETDLPGSGLNSIGRIASILEGLYPGIDYGTAITSLDGGGDATGFVYDTTSLTLLGSTEFTAGLTHHAIRGHFRPVGTAGQADFFVYSTHLKAGNTGSDLSQRAAESALLKADIDALGEGAQVIVTGDFNIRSSSEQSYVTWLSGGAGQLFDPIDSPGTWHNNSAFRSLHTQNPADPSLGGGGLDDRFDFQLISGELTDGVGIDYVDGSYHAFGNNGTHALNGSITSGSGASANVLSALAVASDHLPVVADYEIIASGPGITLIESGNQTEVIEAGHLDTYSLALDTEPTGNVTVTITPDAETDVGNGPGLPLDLLFTPGNAFTPQTVVVTAFDDNIEEGTHTSIILNTSASNDPLYDGLTIPDVPVTVLDDDAPTIVINELDSDNPSIDTMEFVELYDGGIGNAPLDGLSVVFYNGATDESYYAQDLDGLTTNSDGFFLLGNTAFAPDISFSDNFLQNGADAVVVYEDDASNFPNGSAISFDNVMDAVVYDTDDPDDPGLTALLLSGESQVNEDANNNQLTDAIARVPDGGPTRVTHTYVTQPPTPRTFNSPPTTGVLIRQSQGRTDVEEGGSVDSYSVELLTFPTSDVTVTVSPDPQLDLGAGSGVPVALTFTPTNALIPQFVNVAAVDDAAIEGEHVAPVTHSASSVDSEYDGIAIGDVFVNIIDNEAPPVIDIAITEIMYNPDSDETSPGIAEWIEVVNLGNVPTSLDGWTFDDEDSSNWGPFPIDTTLDLNQIAVFFDESYTSESQFRTSWNVPPTALVIGISWGSLSNSPSATNEILQLVDPSSAVQDEVNYDDSGDWPSDNPDGPSIYLQDIAADNNLGTNWQKSAAGVDGAINPGVPFSVEDAGSPGHVPGLALVDADFNDDGNYDCLDIDLLVAEVATGSTDLTFDLTGDAAISYDDVVAWLSEAGSENLGLGKSYLRGDANLDGFVDGSDFITWNTNKFTVTTGWCQGDFNADGFVDGSDFIVWNDFKFQNSDQISFRVNRGTTSTLVARAEGVLTADVNNNEPAGAAMHQAEPRLVQLAYPAHRTAAASNDRPGLHESELLAGPLELEPEATL